MLLFMCIFVCVCVCMFVGGSLRPEATCQSPTLTKAPYLETKWSGRSVKQARRLDSPADMGDLVSQIQEREWESGNRRDYERGMNRGSKLKKQEGSQCTLRIYCSCMTVCYVCVHFVLHLCILSDSSCQRCLSRIGQPLWKVSAYTHTYTNALPQCSWSQLASEC